MEIGIISDTHGHLEDAVFEHFSQCDEIWHAGDIGTMGVLEQLEAFKPTRAVYGNVDGHELRAAVPEVDLIRAGGMNVMLVHIAGKPPGYSQAVKGLLLKHRPQLLVCGHSHILKVAPDKKNSLLYVNPGAAGKHGFHLVKTLLRMKVEGGKVIQMEAIEMGKRGKV